jgi:4'-phosphopantetheinyl transferase
VNSPIVHLRWCRIAAGQADHRPAARRWLRLALGRLLEVDPDALPLRRLDSGQLQLSGWGLSFSHAADVAVVAIASSDAPASDAPAPLLGVDIEPSDRPLPGDRACQRVLSVAELEWWRAQPPAQRQSAFLALWTAKEAAQKARGRGIWQGLPELRPGPIGSRWQARWPAPDSEPLAVQHRPLTGQLLALAFPETWPDSLLASVAAVETDPLGVPLRQASEQ